MNEADFIKIKGACHCGSKELSKSMSDIKGAKTDGYWGICKGCGTSRFIPVSKARTFVSQTQLDVADKIIAALRSEKFNDACEWGTDPAEWLETNKFEILNGGFFL